MLKGKIPLVIAGALAGLAALIAWASLRGQQREVLEKWEPVSVCVATQDIPEGTVLTSDMVGLNLIPARFVSSSIVKRESRDAVIGQRILVPLQARDPFFWSQFETSKTLERLSSVIQKKGRAISITVDAKSAVGGWVRPNDHVDVLGIFPDPSTRESVSVTLLQNVVVLATGKITGSTNVNLLDDGDRSFTDVSLLVLPEEAEILVLAQSLGGGLALSLRNPDDLDVQDERGKATIGTLLTGERTKTLQKLRYQTIQVIRGPSVSDERSGSSAVP